MGRTYSDLSVFINGYPAVSVLHFIRTTSRYEGFVAISPVVSLHHYNYFQEIEDIVTIRNS